MIDDNARMSKTHTHMSRDQKAKTTRNMLHRTATRAGKRCLSNTAARRTAMRATTRSFVTVMRQAEVGYREFLGGNRVRIESGICVNIPLLHTLHRVDTRMQSIVVDSINAFTHDNVPVKVSGTLMFTVLDVEKACFGVTGYRSATQVTGMSAARAVIGRFDYDRITRERGMINAEIAKEIGSRTQKWGVECTEFEIQDFGPQNKEIAHQLERQMEAERARRENELKTQSKINTAEGEKQSAILQAQAYSKSVVLKAEGDQLAAILQAKAYSEAAVLRAEGDRQAAILKSEGDAAGSRNATNALRYQLRKVAKQFDDTAAAAEFLLRLTQATNIGAIANNSSSKTYFFPSDSVLPAAKAAGDLFHSK